MNDSHSLNVISPIDSTEVGIVISLSDLQQLNVKFSIFFIDVGIMIDSNETVFNDH